MTTGRSGRPTAAGFFDISPNRLRHFYQAAHRGSIGAAANYCNCTKKSISDSIKEVKKFADGKELVTYPNGDKDVVELTPYGEKLRDAAKVVIDAVDALSRIEPETCVLSALPHHALWMGKVLQEHAGTLDFRVLDEVDRFVSRFDFAVMSPLMAGTIDAVVGLTPSIGVNEKAKRTTLTVDPLYDARLMAQVLVDDADMVAELLDDDLNVPLDRLVASGHKLLMPPPGVRSRDLFDGAVQSDGLATPPIGYESFETKVLCHYGRLGLGITVLPSDIARAFARTGEFGSYAEAEDPNYYWFPIVDAKGEDITYTVALTYRVKSHPLVEHVVMSIKTLLEEDPNLMDELTGRFPPPPPNHVARPSA